MISPPNATRRWIVRLSGFPFVALGKQIGTVEATTKGGAEQAAQLAYPGKSLVVEPMTTSTEQLERAIAKLGPRKPRGPYGRMPRRQNPMEE